MLYLVLAEVQNRLWHVLPRWQVPSSDALEALLGPGGHSEVTILPLRGYHLDTSSRIASVALTRQVIPKLEGKTLDVDWSILVYS